MQLKKIAVICNVCFWLTLFFQVWSAARSINQHILNTIVIMGILAVIVNAVFLVTLSLRSRQSIPVTEDARTKTPKVAWLNGYLVFNLLSFLAQLYLLYTRYL